MLSTIAKSIKKLEDKIKHLSDTTTDPSEKNMFYLKSAIISEMADITNALKNIEEDLIQTDTHSSKNFYNIYQFAHILRYIKEQIQSTKLT